MLKNEFMPINWIKHNGRLIMHADYRGLKSEDLMMGNLKEEDNAYENAKFKILSLNDYRDTYISKKFMEAITDVGKKHKGKTIKGAVLGITGFKKIFLNTYSKIVGENLRAFDKEEDALEYLTR